jgi:hypothetical protein
MSEGVDGGAPSSVAAVQDDASAAHVESNPVVSNGLELSTSSHPTAPLAVVAAPIATAVGKGALIERFFFVFDSEEKTFFEKASASSSGSVMLSSGEFAALQDSLNQLKTQLYESKAKEQKLQSLGMQWKQKCKTLDEEFQKVCACVCVCVFFFLIIGFPLSRLSFYFAIEFTQKYIIYLHVCIFSVIFIFMVFALISNKQRQKQ